MTYAEFLKEIAPFCEPSFATFQRRLIETKQEILGIRTPKMREIAKRRLSNFEELFSYPDEYFEVTFIKLTALSLLDYKTLTDYIDRAVGLMDNWGICDCFRPKAIKKHREEYLLKLEELFVHGGEFYERYVLVTLLAYYAEEKYIPIIESYLKRADTQKYYIHMAAAWLVAELLIKSYDDGVKILRSCILDEKTHNKAIQKARESFRISKERKEFLNSLKIKKEK
ncbi:MAG: DNA alkylation repair protein [Clostridia bacterium]|nr:DNA alkylation repair protein [Clostridia bacterium]